MLSVFCTLSTAYIELYTVEIFNQIMTSKKWFGVWGIVRTWSLLARSVRLRDLPSTFHVVAISYIICIACIFRTLYTYIIINYNYICTCGRLILLHILLCVNLHKCMQSVFCTLSTAYIELYTVEMFNQIMRRVIWGLGIARTWSLGSHIYIYMHMWPVNIAPYSMCRSIMCKTGEVSCPLYTRVWVPLGWGGWVYTCILTTNNL